MSLSGLYVQLFSVHGLIRGTAPELGRDADTGGQIKYVLELAQALSSFPEIARVDLVTRLIDDKTVSKDYANKVEILNSKARIIRIRCGGKKYLRKELLWPHLNEFIDRTLKFIKSEDMVPDFYHGHYADGGYVAKELATIFNMPFIFTGHSMGRNKKNKLLQDGLKEADINKKYHIDHRIMVEEVIIKRADQIIVSTNDEIGKQYGLYKNFKSGTYKVIPPGIDLEIFYPFYNRHIDNSVESEVVKQTRVTLLKELNRFWVRPDKPIILALCRPDHRKNIGGLIKAYGEDKELQAIANLAIFAGIRKNITAMEENERDVLTRMLLLMDQYDLYGKLAIPKKHDFSVEVPELYRLCADSRGIFVNPSLVEPFGLTIIEAAACGLPIIATRDGGPVDIIGNCNNGVLVDARNSSEIASTAKKILINESMWDRFSQNGINGVRKYYSWDFHGSSYLQLLGSLQGKVPTVTPSAKEVKGIGWRLTKLRRLIICDIDNTLVGNDASMNDFLKLMQKHKNVVGWGVATGRSIDLVHDIFNKHSIPIPDVIITSVGTEIYYGSDLVIDNGWERHLDNQWKPHLIEKTLESLDFLTPQEDGIARRRFKLSYFMEDKPDHLAQVHYLLQKAKLRYNLIFSNHQFLDILPYRASKGKAVRYISYKWEIPIGNIMVCGDSGNDEDMLRGETCGLVVGNYSEELEKLRTAKKIFFSKHNYSAGILDGIRHYAVIKEK